MDFRKLQSFLAVVDVGSVSQAAQGLHITQPALSRQIHTLENELNLKLFETHRGRLHLTYAGREFLGLARDLNARVEQTRAAVNSLVNGTVSKLVVAATPATTTDLLAPFLAAQGAAEPLVLTRQAHHWEIPDLLHAGIDFAVSPVPVSMEYQHLPLRPIRVQAFVAESHRWANLYRTGVRLDELVEERLIASGPGAASRTALDSAVMAAGLSYREIHSCDDASTVKALATSGQGVAILTIPQSKGIRGIPILSPDGQELEQLNVHLTVAWHLEHYAAGTIARLAAALQNFQRKQIPQPLD